MLYGFRPSEAKWLCANMLLMRPFLQKKGFCMGEEWLLI